MFFTKFGKFLAIIFQYFFCPVSVMVPPEKQTSRIYSRICVQENECVENFIARNIGLHDCGGLLGKFETCRAGCQERQAWTSGTGTDAEVHG